MKGYSVQVQVGSNFVDLSVKAENAAQAIVNAKELVKADVSLKLFRHRFANYIV